MVTTGPPAHQEDPLAQATSVKIPHTCLLQVLQGVAVATQTPGAEIEPLRQWISSVFAVPGEDPSSDPSDTSTLVELTRRYHVSFPNPSIKTFHLLSLVLVVSSLRQRSRTNTTVFPNEINYFWRLLYPILISPEITFTVSRSAQGFLAVPLCSLIEDGCIQELFRFHVWMPDGRRSASGFAIHSHQPWARSWILSGDAVDRRYAVEPIVESKQCESIPLEGGQTLVAEYAPAWSSSNGDRGTDYKTHQVSSTVKNTGKLVRVTPGDEKTHTRGDSYSIEAGVFHTTKVDPYELHATLFYFDAGAGFLKDAKVLGPKDMEEFTQVRDPEGNTAESLARKVSAAMKWDDCIKTGQEHAERGEGEYAFKAFHTALAWCTKGGELSNIPNYKYLTMGKLGDTNRRFGRYDQARKVLEEALSDMQAGYLRTRTIGELGVVLRHLNLLDEAKEVFEKQYKTAKEQGFDRPACRALGNLGMVNYQLSLREKDDKLLTLATQQLEDAVKAARAVQNEIHESVNLARLSLCYSAIGDPKRAAHSALESLNTTYKTGDPTMIAMSRFFYGRALLKLGQNEEALEQFNPVGTCTPAIAFCKEPSNEHRQYLRELVEAGVDLDLTDEQGYTALDYAVYNDHKDMQEILIQGFKNKPGGEVELALDARLSEARLRKGYREIFQEKLRPVLLSGESNSKYVLQKLRMVYKGALDMDLEQKQQFDRLKFIRYLDFKKLGKLPSHSGGLLKTFNPDLDIADFIIFFSYRWINKDPGATSPDSVQNTQYYRMVNAIEKFLELHPDVDREKLNLWIDYSCVDQSDPMSGVHALPMIISQCNALISLIDDDYYSRAWCAVEIEMIQALRRTYGHHLWYQHVQSEGTCRDGNEGNGTLERGHDDVEIVMAEKKLSYETDRPKVMFLERQSKLLG